MRVRLTDRFVAAAKVAEGEDRTDYFDETTRGLAVRVAREGHKAWNFFFSSPKTGKRARLKIGEYPGTTLASARTRAVEARAQLDDGKDPRDIFSAQAAGEMTVATLVESYLDKHVRPNLRSADEIERRFNRSVIPMIGSVRVADLHRRDISRAVDPVLRRGSPTEAGRVFEDVRAMLRWAVSRGDLDHNPAEGMKAPTKSAPRERVLTDDEICAFWTGLPKALARSKACQRILQLCLLTAQRVGEISGMAIAELDVAKSSWTIPAARSKNKHAHTVPLSGAALEMITEAIAAAGEGAKFVFPDASGESLPGAAVARTVARANEAGDEFPNGRFGIAHFTAHDLRRTAVSQMAALGIAPIVLGHVINHRSVTKAGVTLAVYSHYDYAKEKAAALELWAERLAAITAAAPAAAVLPMRRRSK
jgi:integrase